MPGTCPIEMGAEVVATSRHVFVATALREKRNIYDMSVKTLCERRSPSRGARGGSTYIARAASRPPPSAGLRANDMTAACRNCEWTGEPYDEDRKKEFLHIGD